MHACTCVCVYGSRFHYLLSCPPLSHLLHTVGRGLASGHGRGVLVSMLGLAGGEALSLRACLASHAAVTQTLKTRGTSHESHDGIKKRWGWEWMLHHININGFRVLTGCTWKQQSRSTPVLWPGSCGGSRARGAASIQSASQVCLFPSSTKTVCAVCVQMLLLLVLLVVVVVLVLFVYVEGA